VGGKDYGLSYAGGTWYADDARRVPRAISRGGSMMDSPIPDFGDYWQHQVRSRKCTCNSSPRAGVSEWPPRLPAEVGGPRGLTSARSIASSSWAYEAHDRLLAGEDIRGRRTDLVLDLSARVTSVKTRSAETSQTVSTKG
jgi:hypothetical protein